MCLGFFFVTSGVLLPYDSAPEVNVFRPAVMNMFGLVPDDEKNNNVGRHHFLRGRPHFMKQNEVTDMFLTMVRHFFGGGQVPSDNF